MAKLQSVNSVAGKETLYVDVDDEITAIIDKVDAAKGKVVALVLPKRCPVLQSVVNMKLLKRTADNNGKNLVLVTSEAGLIPLAGAIGLYVASTPTSRPVIPDTLGSMGDDGPEELEEPLSVVDGNEPEASDADDFNPQSVAGTSVGDLAASAKKSSLMSDETIDMSDIEDAAEVAPTVADVARKTKTPKPKKDKKLKVPNFDGFRKWMVLGVLVIVILIAAIIFALTVLPKATITIATDSNTIPTNLTLTFDTTATSLDTTSNTVPAVSQSQQKTNNATVAATGQQNNGQKASGTITVTNCSGSVVSIQPGNSFSSGAYTFIAQNAASIPDSDYTHSGTCKNDSTGTVNVVALKGGQSYNLGPTSYSLSNASSGVTAQGSQMSGGTDNIITTVQQSDIDSATSKATSASSSTIKQQLEQSIEAQGLEPIPATYLTGTPQTSANQQVGAQASNVTVTVTTTYSMMGVKKSYLQTLIDSNVNGQLDKGKQTILNDGAANAQFAEANSGTNTSATVAMTASSKVGPRISVTALKAALAGKRSADVQSYVEQTPGVTNVTVKFSPFYVDTVPSKASKVQINIVKASS